MAKPQNKMPCLNLVRDSFNYAPRTGLLSYNQPRRLVKVGDSITSGTVKIPAGGVAYSVNRVIWYWMTGEDPGDLIVEHRNGDHNDNRWENLRLATPQQNQFNKIGQGKYPKGVVFKGDANRSKPWAARIRIDGKKVSIGQFYTMEEAAEAYRAYADKIQGSYAAHNSRNTQDG